MTSYILWALLLCALLGCTVLRSATWWALAVLPLAGLAIGLCSGGWLWFALAAWPIVQAAASAPVIERENDERARRGLPPMTKAQLRRRLAGLDIDAKR